MLISFRVYTQNIDGLECLSGIDSSKLVEAHGSFRTAKCIDCNHSYSGIYIKVNSVLKKTIKN
jgi:NAD-dependent SIR2 family protein deacetylase